MGTPSPRAWCRTLEPDRRPVGSIPFVVHLDDEGAAVPSRSGLAVGVYRLWRELGYAVGALLAGLVADALGVRSAIWAIAALTFGSGSWRRVA
jgi:predicted MFS family arabinose efflux permease